MKCPICNNDLIWQGVNLFCENCAKGNPKSVAYFFKILGADNITDTTIKKLGVKTIEDMYNLTEGDIMRMNGFASAKAQIIVYEIKKTLKTTPERLLAAFGIPSIGIENAKVIIRNVEKFDDIFDLSEGETGLGPETEKNFLENIQQYKSLWQFLLDKGLEFKNLTTNKLNGIVIAITGELPFKRDHVIRIIEENGGIFSKSVTKKTKYLLIGTGVENTVKMRNAESKGIKTIDWNEFMNMLGG
ncbi:MAG TPA: hypothetical protein P5140_08555 [Methanofastidiosum sp.]|nr:hypothetical protein [Methanofastidiosum sp.]